MFDTGSPEFLELLKLCSLLHGAKVEASYKAQTEGRIRDLILKLADKDREEMRHWYGPNGFCIPPYERA